MRSQRNPRVICALIVAGLAPWVTLAHAQTETVVATAAPVEIAPEQVVPDRPLPPDAAAFRAALRAEIAPLSEKDRIAIEQFYSMRDYKPYWTLEGSDSLDILLKSLEDSPEQGLPLRRYDPGALAAIFKAPLTETPIALREVAASRTYMRYGSDLSGGILTPWRIDPDIDVKPSRVTASLLMARLNGQPIDRILASLEPSDPDYRRLIAERERLEGLTQSNAWGPEVAAGPSLHQGETDPRIAGLRTRLARLGYGVPTDAVADSTFDAGLAQSVMNFQRDHGLNADGVVGAHTLEEINTSASARLEQVLVNLERMRWLNRDFGDRYILVNIPDFSAAVIENGTEVWRTRAVVGVANKTPSAEFSGMMTYMVINPSWHVPSSIAKRVYLPKLKQDPGILARGGMQLMTQSGTVIDPKLVDFNQLGGSFPFRIRQIPSDDNALGKVKFMFPNDHSIYLHDTPHRDLFAKDARAFSNGCIRLQNPEELAFLLLQGQVSDPQAAFDKWVAAKSERTVMLDRPIPVNLVYRTVFIDQAGVPRYRDDIYGRDAEVFRALEAAGVTVPTAEG